ncbi:MAG: glutamate racemase [Candidatus Saccharimonadales bacterium]
MKIGVFDSGIGGRSVANAIEKAFPDDQVIYRNDSEHVPYGLRPPADLLQLVTPILDEMVKDGCHIIVIACNTVTTTIIKDLRAKLSVPLIGIEPMVKPAVAMTKTGIIAVCATPTTLASKRYKELKQLYALQTRVLEPDCHDWSKMIESQQVDYESISMRINDVCEAGADVIVLGCTHYHWISNEIDAIACAYGAQVIHPENAVILQIKRVLIRD